jgi:hypothetical protein
MFVRMETFYATMRAPTNVPDKDRGGRAAVQPIAAVRSLVVIDCRKRSSVARSGRRAASIPGGPDPLAQEREDSDGRHLPGDDACPPERGRDVAAGDLPDVADAFELAHVERIERQQVRLFTDLSTAIEVVPGRLRGPLMGGGLLGGLDVESAFPLGTGPPGVVYEAMNKNGCLH